MLWKQVNKRPETALSQEEVSPPAKLRLVMERCPADTCGKAGPRPFCAQPLWEGAGRQVGSLV